MLAIDLLKQFSLLNCLDDFELLSVQKSMRDLKITSGTLVFGSQDNESDVYFLISGRLLAVHYTSDGREIVFAAIPQGGYLGELSALGQEKRSLSVYATADSHFGVLPRSKFLELIDMQKEFREHVVGDLVKKIQFLTLHIHDLTAYPVKERLRSFIVRLAAEQNMLRNGATLTNFPTHAEIANHIGANREAVSRAMTALKRAGYIKSARKSVEVVDYENLIPD